MSDQGCESVRSGIVPKITIQQANKVSSVTSSAPTSPTNDLSQPESRKNRVTTSLNPLRVSANFERNKCATNQLILKPDQILLNHEHTEAQPFSFRTDARCGEQKGSIYKRNLDEYQREVNNSLRATSSASRAKDRLTNFKKMNQTHAAFYSSKSKRTEKQQKLEPFALNCNHNGRRATQPERSPSNHSRTRAI